MEGIWECFTLKAAGEGIFYKRLGAGAELGYVAPWRESSEGICLLSLNGMYHFRHNGKVSPFLTAGESRAFRNSHINMANFGAGAHWWFSNKLGLRMEFRDISTTRAIYSTWKVVSACPSDRREEAEFS
jgi:hypothetical protein